jgi:predicted alpha/beta-hydrolase family hydrolase
MRFILQAAAARAAMAGYLTARRALLYLAAGAPNPPAQAPPGLSAPVNTILGWGKWGVLVCGVAGLLICGGKMTIGHRNRAAFAADGATGVPWVLAGLSLAAVAAAIVGVFL